MVDGLTLRQSDEREELIGKRSTTLELLAQYGTLEVTRHWIAAGSHFYLDEASDWSGFEFIYMLNGSMSLESDGERHQIKPGDYIHHQGLSERAFFRVNTDVELLMVSSPPSYHLIQDEIQGMLELARSVEEKDEETEGHCSRIERLAILTGERLGLSGQRLIDLSYGAYLHDIGKVKIPDGILNKNGPLTKEEQKEMRLHTQYGYDVLTEHSFLSGAARIVAAHHENFDGSGYPEGEKAGDIPIEARVVRVADSYDAITSERPYHKALSKRRAIEELVKGAGTQFDPRVVEAFREVIGDTEDA